MLHEMLSGQRAFSGVSGVETASAVLRDEPRPLQGVPPDVTDLVGRCLCKNLAERYQRISDVQSALERTRDRLRTASEPPSAESDASIAVLPFANLSSDKENASCPARTYAMNFTRSRNARNTPRAHAITSPT